MCMTLCFTQNGLAKWQEVYTFILADIVTANLGSCAAYTCRKSIATSIVR